MKDKEEMNEAWAAFFAPQLLPTRTTFGGSPRTGNP